VWVCLVESESNKEKLHFLNISIEYFTSSCRFSKGTIKFQRVALVAIFSTQLLILITFNDFEICFPGALCSGQISCRRIRINAKTASKDFVQE
jgi:hypothetical protein